MDLLNLKPNAVSKDLASYTTLVYAPAKAGKSTLAYKLFGEDMLLVATEKGYKGLSGVLALDITKWADTVKLTKELKKPEVQARFKVLVIDTIDILHELAVKHICITNGVDDLSGLPFGKGYKMVDDLVNDLILTWQRLGYGLFFISHAVEKAEIIKLPNGEERELSKYIPTVNKRTLGIVSKFVDNIFFGYISLNEQGQEERTIFTRETLHYKAGSRFKHLPSKLPMEAEAIKKAMSEAIDKEELTKDERESFVPVFDEVDFETVKAKIVELVKSKFMPSGKMDIVQEITDKHLGMGQKITEANKNQAEALDIVLTILEEKAQELGI